MCVRVRHHAAAHAAPHVRRVHEPHVRRAHEPHVRRAREPHVRRVHVLGRMLRHPHPPPVVLREHPDEVRPVPPPPQARVGLVLLGHQRDEVVQEVIHVGVTGHGSFDTLQDRAADFGILDVGNDVRNGVVWFDGIEQVRLLQICCVTVFQISYIVFAHATHCCTAYEHDKGCMDVGIYR